MLFLSVILICLNDFLCSLLKRKERQHIRNNHTLTSQVNWYMWYLQQRVLLVVFVRISGSEAVYKVNIKFCLAYDELKVREYRVVNEHFHWLSKIFACRDWLKGCQSVP